MGTNYYVKDKGDELHIGKSSMGWCFALHIIPELEINTLTDWMKFWKRKTIKDEYGKPITHKEMWQIITEREWLGDSLNTPPLGYQSWEEFHKQNQSEAGPNGLVRQKISERCVGHGVGLNTCTYDLVIGDFS